MPAADSPVRAYGATVVFSSYDLTRAVDLRMGHSERARGPRDVSGFALLPGGRALWVEPEGEDARLRRVRLSWRAG